MTKNVRSLFFFFVVLLGFAPSSLFAFELDPTFHTFEGMLFSDCPQSLMEEGFKKVIVNPNNRKIIVAGLDNCYASRVVRLRENGENDFITRLSNRMVQVNDIALQDDGKIISIGGMWYEPDRDGGSTSHAMHRIDSNGSEERWDYAFFGRETEMINGADSLFGQRVSVQPINQKIVVAGSVNIPERDGDIIWVGAEQLYIVRYLPDGSLDRTFSGDGIVVRDFISNDDEFVYADVQHMEVFANGKILVVGSLEHSRDNGTRRQTFFIAKYNNDGSLDNGFGRAGIAEVALDENNRSRIVIKDVAIQSNDQKIILALRTENGNISKLLRFNTNGTQDNSLNVNVPLGNMTLQSDNKIVVAYASDQDFIFKRFLSNGNIDNSFDRDGTVRYHFNRNNDTTFFVKDLLFQQNFKLLLLGYIRHPSLGPRTPAKYENFLLRFNTSECGNGGNPEPGEDCDDGNRIDTDVCTNRCRQAICGDGIVRDGVEQCDDENRVNEDTCTNQCRRTICGDGVVQRPNAAGVIETCDNGFRDLITCTNQCTFPQCGNGRHEGGEECDCGDGVPPNELIPQECNNKRNGQPNSICNANCTLAICGDRVVQFWLEEECDEGGNSLLREDLGCPGCRRAFCGDGLVLRGVELCDDGNRNDNDGCGNDCLPNLCGDGIIQSPNFDGVWEDCDDENEIDSDACSDECRLTLCGNGKVESPNSDGVEEECDEGIQQNAIGFWCGPDCHFACGNGITENNLREECDDGNRSNGDGCNSICQNEALPEQPPPPPPPPPGPCQPVPEICDGVDNDCDGAVDEDFPNLGQECLVGEGQCRSQDVFVCRNGRSECRAQARPAEPEICDGLDNNCNGVIDEGFAGQPELCDGVDNNCDGAVDEDFAAQLGQACFVGQGECRAVGAFVCNNGLIFCNAQVGQAGQEICDNLDNDCDGVVDPGCACQIGQARACGNNVGLCRQGQQQCENGQWGICQGAINPQPEVCDNEDNNCNGNVDEGLNCAQALQPPAPVVGAACGNGVVDAGEECDDGNQDNTDACLNTCVAAACGDGQVQVGSEECDDGNLQDGDGCSSQCKNEAGAAAPGGGAPPAPAQGKSGGCSLIR